MVGWKASKCYYTVRPVWSSPLSPLSPLLSGHPLLNGHLSNSQKAVHLFSVNLTSIKGSPLLSGHGHYLEFPIGVFCSISPLLSGHIVSYNALFQGVLTWYYVNHVQFLSIAHQMQHDIHKALIKTRSSNKSSFVWANRPLRAHCSVHEILLLLTSLAANHKKTSCRMPLSFATCTCSSQGGKIICMSRTSRMWLVNRFSFGNTRVSSQISAAVNQTVLKCIK